MGKDEIIENIFSSDEFEKAAPLDFLRFYLTKTSLIVNREVNELLIQKKRNNTVDEKLYTDALTHLIDLSSLLSVFDRDGVLSEFLEKTVQRIDNEKILSVEYLFNVKNAIIELLIEKGLLNVFQLKDIIPRKAL